jgi:hypothetical protein
VTLIYADASRGTARFIHALIFGLWAIRVLAYSLTDLAGLPWAVSQPVYPASKIPPEWVQWLLQPAALRCLQIGTLICLVPLAARIGTRWIGPIACLLLTVRESLPRSFGHVNHAEIPLLLSAYALVLLAWADWIAERNGKPATERPQNASQPLAVLAILLVTYALTGAYRLAHGAPSVFTSDAMTFWSVSRGWYDSEYPFGFGRFAGGSRLVEWSLSVGFVVVTIVELIAPFALVSRWCRVAVLAVILPFHIGTLLIMNIFFPENFILLLLLLDTGRILGRSP